MIKVTTHSAEETIAFAKKIGSMLRSGDVIAFKGGLGAGKTTFTRGIAIGMGLPDEVSSPTFALVNEYRGNIPLCHFDMYRITTEEAFETTGFYDYLSDGCAAAVEWSENIAEFLPKNTINITIEYAGENDRVISVEGDERFDNSWD